ncbi:MAG: hypothetical protein NZO16_05180 [Deltaproteobacteria bacterium]|nr:hypothetical protein [Deltaproteobacteria bacterium]
MPLGLILCDVVLSSVFDRVFLFFGFVAPLLNTNVFVSCMYFCVLDVVIESRMPVGTLGLVVFSFIFVFKLMRSLFMISDRLIWIISLSFACFLVTPGFDFKFIQLVNLLPALIFCTAKNNHG